MRSMTGFGASEAEVKHFGKVSVELRSTNHKFLETVIHLPEGSLSLEDRIKKAIEAKIKRGRLTCVVSFSGIRSPGVFINKDLLKRYISSLKNIKERFGIKDDISINTLIHLPGILSLQEGASSGAGVWPHLKILLERALDDLVKTRQKEGRALSLHLKKRAEAIGISLRKIKLRFKKAIKEKLKCIKTDEERAAFLKDTDITEEIERLAFHIHNFKNKLAKRSPIGKELDFIIQEMQREANTLAAKTFDIVISAQIVQIKSSIEKIREQVQNIE